MLCSGFSEDMRTQYVLSRVIELDEVKRGSANEGGGGCPGDANASFSVVCRKVAVDELTRWG